MERQFEEKEIDKVIFFVNRKEQEAIIFSPSFQKEKMSIERDNTFDYSKAFDYSKGEPESHKYIRSVDDLERLKEKIKANKGKDALDTTHRKIGIV